MIILFAPSEGKREGGDLPPIHRNGFLFPELYSSRLEVIEQYERIKREGSALELSELFGLKDPKEHERYELSFNTATTMKAILRYDGVAYDYLNYPALPSASQEYIDQHVILFSNLFGPLRASDLIPDYKLKQGSSIGTFAPEKFYKEHFSNALDRLIGEEEVLDIRAGFYDKFYIPKYPPTTLKFLKEGKVVSHWAKAYRGIVLREAAKNRVKSVEELLSLNIEGLKLEEIHETKKKKEIVFAIL